MIIGIDFDNTIVGYTKLMSDIAVDSNLIPRYAESLTKREIRNLIRDMHDGESKWRQTQAIAYGERMGEAIMMSGADIFLKNLKKYKIPFYIVSHKSQYATADPNGVDLRKAALRWMDSHRFFDQENGLGVTREQVFFENSRTAKIERIKKLGITHFIDDLIETFEGKSFPASVVKILFGNADQSPVPDVTSFSNWSEIDAFLLDSLSFAGVADDDHKLKTAFCKLLTKDVMRLKRIHGGGNNRVYKIFCSNGDIYAGKQYLQPTREGLSRGEIEFNAFKFLKSHDVNEMPEPIAYDPASNIAIYEYIAGNPLDQSSINNSDIDHVVAFLGKLQKISVLPEALNLPRASAAAFAPVDAVVNIKKRYDSLVDCTKHLEDPTLLEDFLSTLFSPASAKTIEWVKQTCKSSGIAYDLAVNNSELTLSPSDVGFHNALRTADGGITYLDFEYFGWDDPAKMISDFLLHPGMSLNVKHKTRFVEKIMSSFPNPDKLAQRLQVMYPLSALQWALITLNEFIPANMLRRTFAVDIENVEGQRNAQLNKAMEMVTMALNGYHPVELSIIRN